MTPASNPTRAGPRPGESGDDAVEIAIRPIDDDDGEGLVRFHETLDATSQYLRFFMAHPHLSVREVERFTHVDHLGRQALVATVRGEIVAVGRYEQEAGTDTAEVAFVVAQAWRRQGLATTLLHRLAEQARSRGIRTFVAETLTANAPMRHAFQEAGFPFTSRLVDGSDVIRMDIGTGP